MTALTVCLWFDDQAEEAATFYTSLLRDGRINSVDRYSESVAERAGKPAGSVMTVSFEAEGMRFLGLNGGPLFTFNESISLMVSRDTQDGIDELWDSILERGGTEQQCGWIKDQYGLCWQIIPTQLPELMRAGGEAAGAALMNMRRIDIATLEAAAGPTTSS